MSIKKQSAVPANMSIVDKNIASLKANSSLFEDEASFMRTFSANVIALRKIYNLTQDDLAKRICFSNRTISALENGRGFPSSLVLFRLCNTFHLSADAFLSPNGLMSVYTPKVTCTSYGLTRTEFFFSTTSLEQSAFCRFHFLNKENKRKVINFINNLCSCDNMNFPKEVSDRDELDSDLVSGKNK